MGSFSSLYIGGHYIQGWKNCIGQDIAILFTEDDFTDTPHPNWHNNWIYDKGDESLNSLPCFQYESTAGQLIERLELLGYSLAGAQQAWNEGVEEIYRYASPIDSKAGQELQHYYNEEVAFYESFTFDIWSALIKEVIERRIEPIYRYLSAHEEQAGNLKLNNPHLHHILTNFTGSHRQFGFPSFDFDAVLRAMLEKLDPETPVVLDCSQLVHAGVDPHYYACDPPQTVILTEGSSDQRIIEKTLSFLYPHLRGYFSFIDFETANMPGSAGHLATMVKAFVATGVRRPTIAIFDNDAAGLDALRQVESIPLPDEIRIMALPHLDLASHYPTIGPQGRLERDINGIACSLELYLGRDVLEDQSGNLTPVRFSAFNRGIGQWQAEIQNKQGIQNRYLILLKESVDNPELMKVHDWSEMRLVLQLILDTVKDMNQHIEPISPES